MSLNVIPEIAGLAKKQTGLMVKQARLKQPLTQRELADLSGISLRSLQRIENGEVMPRAYTWRRLATHINLTQPQAESNPIIIAAPDRPGLAPKWILSISSLVALFLSFGAYVIQSPTFPETLFETFLMLLAGCVIYALILYRIWR